jgi:hypothetical protein
MSEDLIEFIEQRRSDAGAARESVQGLLDLLHGCPPNHPLTAGRLIPLLTMVGAYVDNVVDGIVPAEGMAL